MKLGPLLPRTLLCLALATSAQAAQADDTADVSRLMREGKYSEAQGRLDRLLLLKPRDPQLRLYKGVIQRESGRLAEATATFTKLSEDHPELPEPYNNLAVILAAQGQYDKARGALEKALRTHPSYATAHNNLSDIYARLASQAYNRALQLDAPPDNGATKLALISELGSPAAAPAGSPARPPLLNPPVVVAAAPTPAPAKPAAAPAPLPAPQAAPAKPVTPPVAAAPASRPVTANPPAVVVDTSREVEQAIQAWAKAWSERNVARYLATYDKSFDPPGQQSRAVWEQDRRARILGKSRITVNLLELQVTVKGGHAVAKFRQDYKADALAVLSRKTLELVKTGDRWLIVKESSGN